jgi:type IV secretory pathway TraG/TraD family ATPase VirD4
LIQLKDESRTSVFASAQMCLNCLADPKVLDAVSADGNFEVDAFLKSNGTLYVVGTSEAQHSMAPVVVALLEAITQAAKQRALSMAGSRLDPPLGLFLDEAANIAPIPSLPRLVADGGGTGITPVVVLQSLAQARDRWGIQAAETIWDGSTVKLVFGGLGNHDDLQRISKLCGEIEQRHGRDASMVRSKAVLLPADIRGLKPWRAFLLYKGLKPAVLKLRPKVAERKMPQRLRGLHQAGAYTSHHLYKSPKRT